jgi:hypothetical protein
MEMLVVGMEAVSEVVLQSMMAALGEEENGQVLQGNGEMYFV